ncbi:MAG: hypothetical protein JNG88_00680, partial [Phycisphaerales bacterium]|nr:hypothetical protein [Phycisphaerales bacterium]
MRIPGALLLRTEIGVAPIRFKQDKATRSRVNDVWNIDEIDKQRFMRVRWSNRADAIEALRTHFGQDAESLIEDAPRMLKAESGPTLTHFAAPSGERATTLDGAFADARTLWFVGKHNCYPAPSTIFGRVITDSG